MQHSRARIPALSMLIFICAALGGWLFFWSSNVLQFWGLGFVFSRAVGLCCFILFVAIMVIRPIPIKTSAIALLYLVIFSFLSFLLSLPVSLAVPKIPVLECLLEGGILAVVCGCGMLVYGAVHGKKMVITHYSLATTLPVANGTLRIALISDLHMGFTIDEHRLQREMERLANEKPDLLIIAGDLVDDVTSPARMQAACKIIGRLPTTFGIFYVYGNHDIASHGPKPKYSKEALDQALIENYIVILEDCARTVAGVTLVGRRDAAFARHAERASLDQLLEGVDRTLPVILIDHQPRERKEAAAAGVTLQLSGHTHAGQVWPMSRLGQLFGYLYGHRRIEQTDCIISAGMGNRGSHLRSGCTAEMVMINLQHQEIT